MGQVMPKEELEPSRAGAPGGTAAPPPLKPSWVLQEPPWPALLQTAPEPGDTEVTPSCLSACGSHCGDTVKFPGRSSSPEAGGCHLYPSLGTAVPSWLLPQPAAMTGCFSSSFPHWLSSDSSPARSAASLRSWNADSLSVAPVGAP